MQEVKPIETLNQVDIDKWNIESSLMIELDKHTPNTEMSQASSSKDFAKITGNINQIKSL